MNHDQRGFTITELIVVMTVGSMVAITILSVSLFFVADVLRSGAQSEMVTTSQNILRDVVEEMRVGSQILTTNTLPDPNQPVGGWNTSNDNHVLIVSVPARNELNEFVFDASSGVLLQNEIVYYSDGDGMLSKRVIANTAVTDNEFTSTCPPAIATVSCPADRELTTDFSDMMFVFYDQDDNITTDATLARSIDVTISLFRPVYGRDVIANNNIRMTLRNPI